MLLFGQKGIETIDKIPAIFQGWIVVLLYYTTFESLTCRTPGKLITGTKVVDYDGGKPTLGQIIGRTFTRLVPFEAFTFLGEDGRGLHDRWPKTQVVKTRK